MWAYCLVGQRDFRSKDSNADKIENTALLISRVVHVLTSQSSFTQVGSMILIRKTAPT